MKKLIVAAILASVSVAPAFAGVDGRENHQQNRILKGVANGSVTGKEFNNLEKREGTIRKEEKFFRAADGGKLTKFDRHVLNQRLNHASHAVHHDRHN